MLWYRVTHQQTVKSDAEHADDAHRPSVAPAASTNAEPTELQRTRQTATSRRLVDVVMSHLRSRRLCVDVNLGFDAQLWAMTNSFVCSL
jgi:predicted extracellular nuclease